MLLLSPSRSARALARVSTESDLSKGVGIEAGAADQRAVDLRLLEERGGVFRLDASAIENTYAIRQGRAQPRGPLRCGS